VLRDQADKPHFRRYFAILVGIIKTDPAQRDRYTWKNKLGELTGKNSSQFFFYDLCQARDIACTIIASWKNSAFFLPSSSQMQKILSLTISLRCVCDTNTYLRA